MPAVRRGSPQVLIRSRLRRPRLLISAITTLSQNILTAAGAPGPELSLDFIGDRRMRRLNRQYRGRDAPTDVLAFSMREALGSIRHQTCLIQATRGRGDTETRKSPRRPLAVSLRRFPHASRPAPELLGDIVISLHTAARQAAARGHSVEEELAMLLVHGILHLCGYDHERGEREARRMRRKEREILRSLGTLPKLVLCV